MIGSATCDLLSLFASAARRALRRPGKAVGRRLRPHHAHVAQNLTNLAMFCWAVGCGYSLGCVDELSWIARPPGAATSHHFYHPDFLSTNLMDISPDSLESVLGNRLPVESQTPDMIFATPHSKPTAKL